MADARSQPSASPAKWDWTRFPYPAHYLKPNKAICAICQENFTEPKVIRRILYEAEPLRILGCGHVYHVSRCHPTVLQSWKAMLEVMLMMIDRMC